MSDDQQDLERRETALGVAVLALHLIAQGHDGRRTAEVALSHLRLQYDVTPENT